MFAVLCKKTSKSNDSRPDVHKSCSSSPDYIAAVYSLTELTKVSWLEPSVFCTVLIEIHNLNRFEYANAVVSFGHIMVA